MQVHGGGGGCGSVGGGLGADSVRRQAVLVGGHASALIFKSALKIQPLMSEIKDSPGSNTITSLCMPLS